MHHLTKIVLNGDRLDLAFAAYQGSVPGQVALVVWEHREATEGLRILGSDIVLKVPPGESANDGVEFLEGSSIQLTSVFGCREQKSDVEREKSKASIPSMPGTGATPLVNIAGDSQVL